MSRARKVRAVFFELRRVLGHDCPAVDLLRAAALIVTEILDDEIDPSGSHVSPIPFYARPLDEAFADSGWRVLAFESTQDYTAHGELDPASFPVSRANKWLSERVQWPRPTEMG